MIIQENLSLKKYNTFLLDVYTNFFSAPENEDELIEILSQQQFKGLPLFILGGGSNVLFKSNFNGLVLKPNITSISIIHENNQKVWIEAGAGLEWDNLVEWCVNRNYYGIENLSHIPGSVGACPVQNIGAYGTEVKDVITQVKGIFIDTLQPFNFKNEECKFSYRNSLFKNTLKSKTIITSVVFELSKNGEIKADYGSVKEELEKLGETNLINTRKAIIKIRESKLPDPKLLGNAGSFFKNPILEKAVAQEIIKTYPDAPHYNIDSNLIKMPAGWLIEKCGWKGKQLNNVAVHEKQALVLINKTGLATGDEILELANKIETSIKETFGIDLEKEVNVV